MSPREPVNPFAPPQTAAPPARSTRVEPGAVPLVIAGWAGTLGVALTIAAWGGPITLLLVLLTVGPASSGVFGLSAFATGFLSRERAVITALFAGAITGPVSIILLDRVDAALAGRGSVPDLLELLIVGGAAMPVGLLGAWLGVIVYRRLCPHG